jgi:hypothetical protein
MKGTTRFISYGFSPQRVSMITAGRGQRNRQKVKMISGVRKIGTAPSRRVPFGQA